MSYLSTAIIGIKIHSSYFQENGQFSISCDGYESNLGDDDDDDDDDYDDFEEGIYKNTSKDGESKPHSILLFGEGVDCVYDEESDNFIVGFKVSSWSEDTVNFSAIPDNYRDYLKKSLEPIFWSEEKFGLYSICEYR